MYDPQALHYLSRTTRPWALIRGLQPNTYYYVQVMAYNAAGPGPASEAQFGVFGSTKMSCNNNFEHNFNCNIVMCRTNNKEGSTEASYICKRGSDRPIDY